MKPEADKLGELPENLFRRLAQRGRPFGGPRSGVVHGGRAGWSHRSAQGELMGRALAPEDVTAVQLARRAGTDPRTFRAWLRAEWRAGHRLLRGHELNARWLFSEADAATLAAEFAARS